MLKHDGTIWVIGSYHNIFRVGAALQDLGFWILNDIVWRKANPMPNFKGTRFTNAHETLIWASKGEKARYTFNYRAMKTLNDELQMRSDWVLPICGGQERLKDATATRRIRRRSPRRCSTACCWPAPSRATSCSIPSSAPARPARWRSGSAATGSASSARTTISRSARERIEAALPLDESAMMTMQRRKAQPSVAFGTLVETGMIAPGSDADRHASAAGARRCAPTARSSSGATGSIHELGATLQGAPSCNGWTFWHFEDADGLKPIDALRQTYMLAHGAVSFAALAAIGRDAKGPSAPPIMFARQPASGLDEARGAVSAAPAVALDWFVGAIRT